MPTLVSNKCMCQTDRFSLSIYLEYNAFVYVMFLKNASILGDRFSLGMGFYLAQSCYLIKVFEISKISEVYTLHYSASFLWLCIAVYEERREKEIKLMSNNDQRKVKGTRA